MIMVHSRCNLGIEKLCESLEFCLLDKMFMNLGVHLGHNLKLNLSESFLICNIGNPGGGSCVSCQERGSAGLPEFIPAALQVSLPPPFTRG